VPFSRPKPPRQGTRLWRPLPITSRPKTVKWRLLNQGRRQAFPLHCGKVPNRKSGSLSSVRYLRSAGHVGARSRPLRQIHNSFEPVTCGPEAPLRKRKKEGLTTCSTNGG
jgi:hypothetical protein